MSSSTNNLDVSSLRTAGNLAWSVLNLLQLFLTVLWTAAWASLALVWHALGARPGSVLRLAGRCWAPGLLAVGKVKLVVEGGQDINWSQPHLLVSNHQSLVDICVLFIAVPAPLRFVLKAEMLKVPFLNWYAKATGMVFLDRSSRRAGAVVRRQTAALLGQAQNVCLFPEGTRSRSGALASFKPGLLQAAIDAGVAVVPVAVDGCWAVLPAQGLFRVRPGTVRVRIGAPIPVRDDDGVLLDRQDLTHRAHAAVRTMLELGV